MRRCMKLLASTVCHGGSPTLSPRQFFWRIRVCLSTSRFACVGGAHESYAEGGRTHRRCLLPYSGQRWLYASPYGGDVWPGHSDFAPSVRPSHRSQHAVPASVYAAPRGSASRPRLRRPPSHRGCKGRCQRLGTGLPPGPGSLCACGQGCVHVPGTRPSPLAPAGIVHGTGNGAAALEFASCHSPRGGSTRDKIIGLLKCSSVCLSPVARTVVSVALRFRIVATRTLVHTMQSEVDITTHDSSSGTSQTELACFLK